MEQLCFFASLGESKKLLALRLMDCVNLIGKMLPGISSSNKTLFQQKLTFHEIQRKMKDIPILPRI